MGIKSNFLKFIKTYARDCFQVVDLSEFNGKRVAIDTSLYLYKYKIISGKYWMSSFVNFIASLRDQGIECVFIFDGKTPVEKIYEREKRQENRTKIENQVMILEQALQQYITTGEIRDCLTELCKKNTNPHKRLLCPVNNSSVDIELVQYKIEQKNKQLKGISGSDITNAKAILDILNIPYYIAPWEAEKMCSKLCIDNKVDAVMTEDSDVIAYGAPIFIHDVNTTRNTCTVLKYKELIDTLGFDRYSMLDFCIMCGTDYNKNIPRVGSKTAFKKLQQYKTVNTFHEQTGQDISMLCYDVTSKLFKEFEEYGIDEIPYCGEPDMEQLREFFKRHLMRLNIHTLKNKLHNKWDT